MDIGESKQLLKQRIADTEERIQKACARAGRKRDEVTMIAVTKTVSAETAQLLPELGVGDLGESRPQILWEKAARLEDGIRWNLVGHLQRNKIERTLPLVHLIHSVDSMRLLHALEKEAAKTDQHVDVLLEVNTGGEMQKHGFTPDDMQELPPQINACRFVRVCGLMTMAPYLPNPDDCRPCFRKLRELRDVLAPAMHSEHTMEHLSMGMTNDFEVAIEEGATMVRLGTVLFEGLDRLG